MNKNSNKQELFLYRLTLTQPYTDPAKWTEQDYHIIAKHAQFLDRLGESGILICAGRTQYDPGHPDLFGIAILQAASLAEAEEIMASDPAVIHSIQKAEIHPFSLGIRHFHNILE